MVIADSQQNMERLQSLLINVKSKIRASNDLGFPGLHIKLIEITRSFKLDKQICLQLNLLHYNSIMISAHHIMRTIRLYLVKINVLRPLDDTIRYHHGPPNIIYVLPCPIKIA